jgi:hypothetical protein
LSFHEDLSSYRLLDSEEPRAGERGILAFPRKKFLILSQKWIAFTKYLLMARAQKHCVGVSTQKSKLIRAGSVRLKFRQFIVDSQVWYFYTPGIKVEKMSRFQIIRGSEMQTAVGSLFVTVHKSTGRSMLGRR